MRRLAVLFLLSLAAAGAAAWFADHPGRAVIDWFGWRVETSFAALALLALAALLAGVVLQGVFGWLRQELPLVGRRRQTRRQQRGFDMLNRAMVALAAGDQRQARRLTRQAQLLLPPQPLTHVMAAEAAKLAGDGEAVAEHYKALSQDEAAGFLGVRGLLIEARNAGRDREALRLAEQARALRPDSRWVTETLFSLQVKASAWAAAEDTLSAARKQKLFGPEAIDRHKAALEYCRAVEAELAGDPAAATRLARAALKRRPGFVPAALLAARQLRAAGQTPEAAKVITAAWATAPHPALAQLYESLEPMETTHERYRRFKALAAANPGHAESRLQRVEKALAADHADDVAGDLETLLRTAPTARTFRLKAEAVRRRAAKDGSAAAGEQADSWLARAAAVPAEPGWVCATCGAHRASWTAVCPSCHSFDSYDWRTSGVPGGAGGLAGAGRQPLALMEPAAPPAPDA